MIKSKRNANNSAVYSAHLAPDLIEEELKSGVLRQGFLRINARNYEQSFIDNPDSPVDIGIYGLVDRNRALHSDLVAVRIKPKSEWKINEDYLQSLKSRNPGVVTEEGNADSAAPQTSASPHPLLTISGDLQSQLENLGIGRSQSGIERENSGVSGKSHSSKQSGGSMTGASPHRNDMTPDKVNKENTPGRQTSSNNKLYTRLKDWRDPDAVPSDQLQMTAEVVAILERNHSRCAVGALKPMFKSDRFALFAPVDSKIPRFTVPMGECPPDFLHQVDKYEESLFMAKMVDWPETSKFARGTLSCCLGKAGEIEPETEGMLLQYEFDSTEFADEVISCLPKVKTPGSWTIPKIEYENRRDFRQECLFSIDPATARDLDDALHLKKLPGGRLEIGVHIADVAYFVTPDNALDQAASSRGTSVYLVHKVVPMLPRLLCEELCSLNPGVDRLSFSVVWQMDEEGNAYEEWFGRSVICSCAKLSYDYAQNFIENPTKSWSREELPTIFGQYGPDDIRDAVLALYQISQGLREKRFSNGALRLDQPKLSFALSGDNGMPIGCHTYKLRDSNRLIEEFMLLANMAVSRRIYKYFPQLALLRRHPPPKPKQLKESIELCGALGFPIDGEDAGSMHSSLMEYQRQAAAGDDRVRQALPVLVNLCSKPMQLAEYFCTGVISEPPLFHHYALNVPFYTHFTSPIRRYPDIVVHRLLAASLDYSAAPAWSPEEIQKRAVHCNNRKSSAKAVSELSTELFFNLFIKECGPLRVKGVVAGVMDYSLDILLPELGQIKRVYISLDKRIAKFNFVEALLPEMHVVWHSDPTQGGVEDHGNPGQEGGPQSTQIIAILTTVDVELISETKPMKIVARLCHPNAISTSTIPSLEDRMGDFDDTIDD